MFLSEIFKLIIRQPIFNLLMFFYVYVTGHDLGIAIILLTIVILLLLWPIQRKAMKAQVVLQQLQPKIKELEKMYKGDKQKQAEEMMKLYKTQEINPFSGILMMFLQWPIFFAMYRIFVDVFNTSNMGLLYGFIPRPEVVSTMFLGVIDLKLPSIPLAILAAILQIIQIRIMMKRSGAAANKSQKIMNYVFAGLIVYLLFIWPAALALYYSVFTVFSILQQIIIQKELEKHGQKIIAEGNTKAN